MPCYKCSMIRQFFLFFIFLFSFYGAGPLQAQVNIEKVRPSLENGLNVSLGLTYAVRSGNQNRVDLGGGGRVGYRFNSSELFLIGNTGYGRSNGETYANRSFAHLRFVGEVHPKMALEIFGQVENDEFTRLNLRTLAGIGFRITWIDQEHFQWIQGSGPMPVHETLKDTDLVVHPARQTLVRWNNYTLLRFTFSEKIAFLSTFYFQPAFTTFYDSRILLDATLSFSLTTTITWTTQLNMRYDSRPPDPIGKKDLDVSNGIQITFPP